MSPSPIFLVLFSRQARDLFQLCFEFRLTKPSPTAVLNVSSVCLTLQSMLASCKVSCESEQGADLSRSLDGALTTRFA